MLASLTDRLIATVITIGSLLFPFIDGLDPAFKDVAINLVDNSLTLSMNLTNCYSDEFDRILTSGQPVTVHFLAELYDNRTRQVVLQRNFYHTARYNPLNKQFEIYRSERDEQRICETLDDAHVWFGALYRVKLITPENLERNRDYFFRISAYLEPITFIGEKSRFDLMLYWNNKKPKIDTETFNSAIFYR
ncbi:MAG TPA: DUF4390 domain-containing protein [Candidatus Marinimicrobia bacterium]|nr:DUF4390 domain-containing protein [Candidatus Neomarinimicrobiota bacterium]